MSEKGRLGQTETNEWTDERVRRRRSNHVSLMLGTNMCSYVGGYIHAGISTAPEHIP